MIHSFHNAIWSAAVMLGVALGVSGQIVFGQAPPFAVAAPPQPAALPEPIYWKQQLFLVPYQWGSAAQASTAQTVYLIVSKDRGATWQKISEAKPNVKAFNYRAEADGEYWFANRIIDTAGRMWPVGPYQPELRVIVDTTLPRIDMVRARSTETGAIEIQWSMSDANLNPATWQLEWITPSGSWEPVALQAPGNGERGAGVSVAYWQPPAGSRPSTIRANVSDAARNTATYQATVDYTPAMNGPVLSQPSTVGAAPGIAAPTLTPPAATTASLPTVSPFAAPSASMPPAATTNPLFPAATTATTTPAMNQQWPASAEVRTPFRLWTSAPAKTDDGVTSYGDPKLNAPQMSSPRVSATLAPTSSPSSVPSVKATYADAGTTSPSLVPTAPPLAGPTFTPLQPFRQASVTRLPSPGNADVGPIEMTPSEAPSADASASPVTPPVAPKLVGSRTFALEYDLDSIGHWGVSKVELWGTRDGGKSWRSYTQDDDNRSPLVVTVDDEGVYGFCIVADSAGSAESNRPRPGDAPELWVAVDLQRPVVELTGIERGQGNMADHLVLRWRAADNNLESRPIGIFYSSRPSGPWSAVATNLEDTGEYAWRVERHVPARIFLRIEARDTAGNLAAFQTRQPVDLPSDALNGQLRGSAPTGATAVGVDAGYR